MNLTELDLNLLVALEALLREASVSRAAERLGLSQPAASHALNRLRTLFGDPLLVRVGQGMELTPRAEALRAPLQDALTQVRAVFEAEQFSPAVSRRRFTLMMPDLAASLLIPPLVDILEAEAPNLRLEITAWRGPGIVTPAFARTLDLVVSHQGHPFQGFHRRRLYVDTDVLAVRADHPARERLSDLGAFLRARHVAVAGRGEAADPIDVWLGEQGLVREVVLTASSPLQALQVAAQTELVAFVPSRLAATAGADLGLVAVRPPLDPGVDEQFLFYPTRFQNDPALTWLRGLVMDIGRQLGRPPEPQIGAWERPILPAEDASEPEDQPV